MHLLLMYLVLFERVALNVDWPATACTSAHCRVHQDPAHSAVSHDFLQQRSFGLLLTESYVQLLVVAVVCQLAGTELYSKPSRWPAEARLIRALGRLASSAFGAGRGFKLQQYQKPSIGQHDQEGCVASVAARRPCRDSRG